MRIGVPEAVRPLSSCARCVDIYLSPKLKRCHVLSYGAQSIVWPSYCCDENLVYFIHEEKRECASARIQILKNRKCCSAPEAGINHEIALCTRRPTSKIHSSSSAPSQRALSPSANVRAHSDFCRAVNVGCSMIISWSCGNTSEGLRTDGTGRTSLVTKFERRNIPPS